MFDYRFITYLMLRPAVKEFW